MKKNRKKLPLYGLTACFIRVPTATEHYKRPWSRTVNSFRKEFTLLSEQGTRANLVQRCAAELAALIRIPLEGGNRLNRKKVPLHGAFIIIFRWPDRTKILLEKLYQPKSSTHLAECKSFPLKLAFLVEMKGNHILQISFCRAAWRSR